MNEEDTSETEDHGGPGHARRPRKVEGATFEQNKSSMVLLESILVQKAIGASRISVRVVERYRSDGNLFPYTSKC